ncbi:YigZ family protein [Oceanospirillum sediminis]|uniref:YigZ family protein n=1 Tax=Oceanospirillum sediminis TaxID=2760088 RepID=A0A839ISK5_9GAMM|nr:YigZ family protein [Oceanospirillum sediminis]
MRSNKQAPAPYMKPGERAEITLEIKRSQFITIAAPVADVAACHAFIQSVRDEYPDARHHCTAFVAGAPNDTQCYGMSDDGEPSGTAGKPMFNVLSHSGIGQIAIVCVRYFGGIKLGTGGLVKAYSQATQMVLDELDLIEVRPQYQVDIQADYAFESDIRHWLQQLDATTLDCQYSDKVSLTVRLEEPEKLAEKLQQVGQGRIECKIQDQN